MKYIFYPILSLDISIQNPYHSCLMELTQYLKFHLREKEIMFLNNLKSISMSWIAI